MSTAWRRKAAPTQHHTCANPVHISSVDWSQNTQQSYVAVRLRFRPRGALL